MDFDAVLDVNLKGTFIVRGQNVPLSSDASLMPNICCADDRNCLYGIR